MNDDQIDEYERLRAMGLAILATSSPDRWLGNAAEDVIFAMGGGPWPEWWVDYRIVTNAVDGQWFYWRDGLNGTHVDRAMATDGKIEGKEGCGLDIYTECQPCRFAPDVAAAVAAYQERQS